MRLIDTFMFDWYGQTGIYKTGLFWHPSIIVCSPELCKKVLTDDDRFTVGYSSGMLKLLGRKTLHGVSETEHKRLRRLMTAPINGHEALNMHISYIEDIVISSLEEWANMNSPIEFLKELKKISFNVITKIFTGSIDFLSMIKYFTDAFKGLDALPINFPGFTFHRALKARKILVNIIKAHMDEKRYRKTYEPNTKMRMIDLLWEVKDDDAVAAIRLTIYLHDHPEMLRRAKEEQMEIIKRRPSSQKGLTLNELRQMEYLSKAIDETMRISNITFSVSRKAKVDVEINGSMRCPGAGLNKILVSIFLHYFLLNYRYGQTGIYKTGLFWHPSIIVCSPELCKKVLTDDDRFTVGYSSGMLKLLGRKALHGVSESEHKRLRRLMTAPINGHEALSMHISYIEDIVISSLEEWANMNSPIEFLNELKKISFNVITKIFMGSTDSLSKSIIKYFADVFKGLDALPINFPGFTFHRALKARKILVNIIKAHMDEKRFNTKTRMIDLLWEVKDDDGEKLEDEHIVNLLQGFLLAGHEPTAVAAMRLTIYLHDRPEMLRRAKEEQMEIIKRRPSSQKGLTLNELRQMEYLSKAIDETMRISNITFSISRKAKVDVEINGYIIPKGWKVLSWSGAVHLNSENYSSPKEFLPSRWDNHIPKSGTFIPFGAGSRRCPGADLNKILVSIFLHYFLLNYRLEWINPSSTHIDNCLAKITKLSSYDHA
ncbi:hypothetical protein REPUB_Repub08aG0219900 [Reevesia pubescens]